MYMYILLCLFLMETGCCVLLLMYTYRCVLSVDQVIALYPYSAQNEDELTFHKDSVINVMSKDDADWWQGEVNGTVGMFPSNYVGALTSPPQENTCK